MEARAISRRNLMLAGGATLAGLAFRRLDRLVAAAPLQPGEELVPWLDQRTEMPAPAQARVGQQLVWEELDSWITPNEKFFTVKHFGQPDVDLQAWRLDVAGLVRQPVSLTLDQLKARPRQEVTFTIECSGNHGFSWNGGLVGNATWAGTPLAPLLQEAGILDHGKDVVFYGHDIGKQTVRDMELTAPFARSLSVADAMNPANQLCYEMNGEPLPASHGAPVRLVVPGTYGVANVKWLDRVDVIDTRFAGHFMARDYVTIREEQRDGQPVFTETLVGKSLLKSAPARVTRQGGAYRIVGAAWGAPVAQVEVQVDGGPWMPATIDEGVGSDYAWKLWSVSWPGATPGEHAITSRAIDVAGNVQPAMTDPRIANKRTYWESNGQITRRVSIA
ncbi:MAG TPA: sulfite oxidase [Chloroflexota bacterium]|nr:sulfite oxidase [Chloroflexota bacterium]